MRLGSRAKLTIGIGVVAACGFVYLGLREFSGPAVTVAAAQERPAPAATQVLFAIATRAIGIGETITAEMIRSAALDPARFPLAAAPVEVIGKVATRDIPANGPIVRTAIGQEASLAIRVPVGMRAVSIDTTAEIAVAGLLRPGDRVDVQVVYPGADAISGARGIGRSHGQTLLQMVQVLAVGDAVVGTQPPASAVAQLGGAAADGSSPAPPPPVAPAPAVARTVTLALLPEQVSALSLARSTGGLYLSLRNPGDAIQPQIARTVSSGPLPMMPVAMPASPPQQQVVRVPPQALGQQAASPARTRAAPHPIDLVVGGNHQVIYSGNGR